MTTSPPLPLSLPTDPHSRAGSSPARAHHLALDLVVDFASRTLAGSATWHLTPAETAPEAAPEAAPEVVFDRSESVV